MVTVCPSQFATRRRSEERRVGKECGFRSSPYHCLLRLPRTRLRQSDKPVFFFFKQKSAYDLGLGIPAEPLFRSRCTLCGHFLQVALTLILVVGYAIAAS